jgi:hypothetical protein
MGTLGCMPLGAEPITGMPEIKTDRLGIGWQCRPAPGVAGPAPLLQAYGLVPGRRATISNSLQSPFLRFSSITLTLTKPPSVSSFVSESAFSML